MTDVFTNPRYLTGFRNLDNVLGESENQPGIKRGTVSVFVYDDLKKSDIVPKILYKSIRDSNQKVLYTTPSGSLELSNDYVWFYGSTTPNELVKDIIPKTIDEHKDWYDIFIFNFPTLVHYYSSRYDEIMRILRIHAQTLNKSIVLIMSKMIYKQYPDYYLQSDKVVLVDIVEVHKKGNICSFPILKFELIKNRGESHGGTYYTAIED